MGLSKRQIQLRYGFNARLVGTLLNEGVLTTLPGCTPLRPKVDLASLVNLRVGEHYIVCQECGAYQAQITTRHLKSCSDLDLASYQKKYPDEPLLSAWCSKNKVKTDKQRNAQSATLKARFQTPEGDITRQQISVHAKKVMVEGYQKQAVLHLRALGNDPIIRESRRLEMLNRWSSGEFRGVVEGWHREHREESLYWAAHARRYSRKVSKPHRRFKVALLGAGISGFITEFEVAFYAIDEAHPELKIAIEVDGCYWHGCTRCGFPGVGNNPRRDKSKTTFLRNRGWEVFRFPTHELKEDLGGCVTAVQEALEQRGAI